MAEGDYRHLPKTSVKHFQAVMRFLIRHHGSVKAALAATGVSDHAYRRLVDDDLVVKCVGQKILNAYSHIEKKGAGGMIKIYNEGAAILQGMSLVEKFEHIPLLPYGRDKWKTAAAGKFCIHTEFARVIIEMDAGFETDLDTVPREIPFLYSWLKGRTRTGAVIHDALYRAGVDREVADYVFLRAMQLEGVKIRYRYAIFLGVRFFGKKVYERVKLHAA